MMIKGQGFAFSSRPFTRLRGLQMILTAGEKRTRTLPAKIISCTFLVFFLVAGVSPARKNVKDLLGREMVIPDNPRRIVALAPSVTEIIYALGQEHRLVGVTQFSDYPEAARHLPQVGSYVQLDLKRIVALRPDLCIAIKDGNPKAVIDRLASLGIPVYAVDPRDLETVMQTIIAIGNILDAEQKASRIVNDIQQRVDAVKVTAAKAQSRPRVFLQIGISPIVSVGSPTFIHQLIEMAGGENLAAGPVSYPRFSREQVLGMAPEVIIITSMERSTVFEEVKAEWARWTQLPAVRDHRIFLVDSNLFDRPTPRLVEGLEMLAKLIHPELFKEGK